MKKAFILIELVSAMVILAVVFAGIFYYYQQLYKNYENLNLFERLYALENQLYEKPHFKTITLKTSVLNPMKIQEQFVSDGLFQFQKLNFEDQNYTVYFKE